MPMASETASPSRTCPRHSAGAARCIVAAGALALGALAALAWWLFVRGDAAPTFRLAKVERGALTAVVSASGTLSAVTTVAVGSQISGQIKELFVDFNSPVKQGQLLARIDPETYDLKVKQAQADLDAAASALANQKGNVLVLKSQALRARIQANDAKADLERKQSLFAKGFISDAERDKAQFNYDALAEAVQTAEAQVAVGEAQVANAAAVIKQREAALASARVDLARTSIVAPVDGVVISRQVDAGQTVAASLNTPTLFTIAKDLRDMQVEVAIDESDISKIRLGQRVTFTVDAFAGRTFEGKVAQIRKAAQIGAERRHLHRRRRDRESEPAAGAGNDRQRAHRLRRARERAESAERGAALSSARRRGHEGRRGSGSGAGHGRRRRAGTPREAGRRAQARRRAAGPARRGVRRTPREDGGTERSPRGGSPAAGRAAARRCPAEDQRDAQSGAAEAVRGDRRRGSRAQRSPAAAASTSSATTAGRAKWLCVSAFPTAMRRRSSAATSRTAPR